MSSLGDDLLADLGSDDEEQQEQTSGYQETEPHASGSKRKLEDDLDEDDDGDLEAAFSANAKLPENAIKPSEEITGDDIKDLDFGPGNVKSVSSISTLLGSKKLESTLSSIAHYQSQAEASTSNGGGPSSIEALAQSQLSGSLEMSDEYQIIVRANNLAVEVENEITLVHKFVRDHYAPRFPELDTIIPKPWDYIQAVEAIGNPDDLTAPQRNGKLDSALTRALIVPISIAASTSTGHKLSEAEWDQVKEGIRVLYELGRVTRTILDYVESRMAFIAPNLSALVGSSVATKLLGISGGLAGLSKIPACNIQVLGSTKKTSVGTGLSALSHRDRHVGFVNQAPLMSEVPPDLHRQAVRLISAKVCLVARMDANHSAPLGTYGSKLRKELSQKIEKLMEPPPLKMIKALPVPVEGGQKQRRGGRRARKLKEMYGTSRLSKMANRVEFGKEEEEIGAFDETIGLGMAGSKASSGSIRASAGESRTKAKMSKKNQNRLEALQRGARTNLEDMAGGSSSSSGPTAAAETSGTQTSLSFTPHQGIELSRKRAAQDKANEKWFQGGQFSLVPSVNGGIIPPGGKKTT